MSRGKVLDPPPLEGMEIERGWWETHTLRLGFVDGLACGVGLVMVLLAGLGTWLEAGTGAGAVFVVSVVFAALVAFKIGLSVEERP